MIEILPKVFRLEIRTLSEIWVKRFVSLLTMRKMVELSTKYGVSVARVLEVTCYAV